MHLRVATLERTVFDGEITQVTIPGEEGELTVLPNHAPLITPLKLGAIRAVRNGDEFYMALSSGMAEVQPHRVLILADQAERAEEIDARLAEEARARAEHVMAERHLDEESFAAAEAELQKALLHLKIAAKVRRKI